MAGCETPAEFVRALTSPSRNRKLIRATLGDLTLEDWALPSIDEALRDADDVRFEELRDAARPSLSRKRVRRVCGPSLGAHWDRFFSDEKAAPKPPPAATKPPTKVKRKAPRTSAARSVLQPARTAGVPLRDAGALLEAAIAREAAEKVTAAAKEREKIDRYLQATVQCRECLRPYKRAQLPNPRRHVCEDCGGQPESTSVRTVSGGSPGLGRRR